MIKNWMWSLGVFITLTITFQPAEAAVNACANQQKACQIASSASQLSGSADAASHWNLRWAAYQLYLVGYDFCRCDYSYHLPGSGDLVSAWDQVKYEFGAIGGAPAATRPEVNQMLQLKKLIGF